MTTVSGGQDPHSANAIVGRASGSHGLGLVSALVPTKNDDHEQTRASTARMIVRVRQVMSAAVMIVHVRH